MAYPEDMTNIFENYGMTTYEAKVFNAVITLGVSSASELSIASDVPRSRIYDVLSGLARKGWIRVVDSKPITYASPDLDEIKTKLDKAEKDIKRANKHILDHMKANIRTESAIEGDDGVELLLGRKESLNEIIAQINYARFRVWLCFPEAMLMDAVTDELRSAKRRGVEIRITLNKRVADKISFPVRGERFLVKVTDVEGHCNMLTDNSFYANIYFRGGDIQANKVMYKKCIHCLSAWMDREWGSV